MSENEKGTMIWLLSPIEVSSKMRAIGDRIAECVPEEKKMIATLLFEEAYMNVATHAYKGLSSSKGIIITFNPNNYKLTIKDRGVYFDPTQFKLEDPDANQIGGQGIRIIKELSNKVTYERTENDSNLLTIWL